MHRKEPVETHSVTLEAGAEAFGNAEHPSTQGAMLALQQLAPLVSFTSILDMGCGSGILALMAAQLWPESHILGADNARSAVQAAQENVADNGVSARICVVRSQGFDHADITAHAPYELIMENILAETISMLVTDNAAHLAPGGMLVLSGILSWQEEEVRTLHEAAGLVHCYSLAVQDWRTLVLKNPD